jgi:hypothetical protein
MTPTMTGAATMLPAQPGAAVPAHTMSPASRTFPGGGSTRKKPVALFAVGGLLVVATVAAVFVLALSDKPAATTATPSDATAVASAASAVPSTAEDPSPAATERRNGALGATHGLGFEPGSEAAAAESHDPDAARSADTRGAPNGEAEAAHHDAGPQGKGENPPAIARGLAPATRGVARLLRGGPRCLIGG